MGEIYRARDTRLDRTVAIKILPSDLYSSPERKQRFERRGPTVPGEGSCARRPQPWPSYSTMLIQLEDQ
jgi:serine/threonine protein kinase